MFFLEQAAVQELPGSLHVWSEGECSQPSDLPSNIADNLPSNLYRGRYRERMFEVR